MALTQHETREAMNGLLQLVYKHIRQSQQVYTSQAFWIAQAQGSAEQLAHLAFTLKPEMRERVQTKTPGQIAYEEDVKREPNYGDTQRGTWPRESWAGLSEVARDSWERNPTVRAVYVDTETVGDQQPIRLSRSIRVF